MEISCTISPGFSSAKFLQQTKHFNKRNILSRQNSHASKTIFPLSKNLLKRSVKNSLPLIARQRCCGRKSPLSIKAFTPDRIGEGASDSAISKGLQFLDVVLRFMKLPIQIGTTVAFTGIFTRTWLKNAHILTMPKWIYLLKASAALVSLLCTNGFISGINQIYDIEIDKINKPHSYPLASGEMSLQTAWILVISYLSIGITIPILVKSTPLLVYILYLTVLGSLYSVPPFSLKRSTFGAILTFGLTGIAYPIGLSTAARNIMGLQFELSGPIIFMEISFTLVSLVAGAWKDIEDLEGDKKYNVPTLASIYGPRKIASFGCGSLLLNYVGAIITSIFMPQVFKQSIMIPAHAILALYLIFQIWKLERGNYTKEVSQSVYQSIMKLQFSEFILHPFI